MVRQSALESAQVFAAQYVRVIEAACVDAHWDRWELPRTCFVEALHRSAVKHFRGGSAEDARIEEYLTSLHLQDLALACACMEGSDAAWEFFIANFRPVLRASAGAILRGTGGPSGRADELADSLYAELYGLSATGSQKRKSLFEYFHGRSKLSTWLRSVLAQRHVDLLRTGQRTVSMDSGGAEGTRWPIAAVESALVDPDREKYLEIFQQALSAALAGLAPRKRLLLAQYYVDRITLSEIGRILREHESTISRQLDQVRRELRERVTQSLRTGTPPPGLDDAQIALTFEYALGDWPFDLSRALAPEETAGSE
jgi:RNA polymerase sigma-70 factor (ECF subfamily)